MAKLSFATYFNSKEMKIDTKNKQKSTIELNKNKNRMIFRVFHQKYKEFCVLFLSLFWEMLQLYFLYLGEKDFMNMVSTSCQTTRETSILNGRSDLPSDSFDLPFN